MPGAHLVRDPLDARYTYVQSSSIQGAGEGLFAKKNIEAQTIVSVYSGLTMSMEQFMADANLRQSNDSFNLVAPNAIGLDPDQVTILKNTRNDNHVFRLLTFPPTCSTTPPVVTRPTMRWNQTVVMCL